MEAEFQTRRAGIQIRTGNTTLASILRKAEFDKSAGRTKRNVLKHLKAGIGHIIVEQLTAQDIIGYIDGRNYSPSTAQQELPMTA